jgi:hypothetical protein
MHSGPSPPVRHVYHLNTVRLLALPVVWALLTALLLLPFLTATGLDPAEDAALLLGAAVVTLILLPIFAITWQSRLVLTAQGIAHHQLGYTVRSPWANLVALDLSAGRQALTLGEPGCSSRLLRWASLAMAFAMPDWAEGLYGDVDALAQGRLIPLAPFMSHWKQGPLHADLLRWAPHVFAASTARTAAA